MCGITGILSYQAAVNPSVLEAMTQTLARRGPDGQGFHYSQGKSAAIGLGHRRLSVIDVSTLASQPMSFAHLHLTFNGEIYNYVEIRATLCQAGYTFDTTSDTEVILKGFHYWGIEVINKCEGMFAFAIWDENAEKLWLVRDRMGVKPLYYHQTASVFLFASELKALLKHPHFSPQRSIDATALFFTYGYIPEPYSIYQHTYKLPAGHYGVLDARTREWKLTAYWQLQAQYLQSPLVISREEAKNHIEILLKKAFERRMVADVPVGVFLSGGYDSAAVTALLQKDRTEKLKTFTIGFEDSSFDESPYAKKVATHLGTDHTTYYCNSADIKALLPDFATYFDEPFADSVAIPNMILAREARKSVTVALSADGGDELFGGYERYLGVAAYYEKWKKWGFRTPSFLSDLQLPSFFSDKSHIIWHLLHHQAQPETIHILTSQQFLYPRLHTVLSHVPHTEPISAFAQKIPSAYLSPSQRMMAMDAQTYLRDCILKKVDMSTMWASLEGREPFLDTALWEFIPRLPHDFLLKDNVLKSLLKDIVHQHLPQSYMQRPKQGFAIPVAKWLRKDWTNLVNDMLSEDALLRAGVFEVKGVRNVLQRFQAGNDALAPFIWSVLIWQLWDNAQK